jgi:hypothetical protein
MPARDTMVAARARSDEGPAYASGIHQESRARFVNPLLQQHTHQEISPVAASPSTHHLRLVTMPSLRPGRLLKRGRGRDDERAARHFPGSQDRRDQTGRNASMPGPSSSVYVDSTVDTGVLVVLTGRASSPVCPSVCRIFILLPYYNTIRFNTIR